MIAEYWKLTKPGIVRGNLLVAFAGYMLASLGSFSTIYLLGSLFGIALIIASGCVWNNVIDIRIDANMSRTKKRPLVIGTITRSHALVFGSILGVAGLLLLFVYANALTLLLGIVSWLLYVFVYAYAKRKTNYGTIIGAIPGAMPPVAGYTAYAGALDATAIALFFTLFMWQLPHFYAISIFRLQEYTKAHIPTLPSQKGVRYTQYAIVATIGGFLVSLFLLFASAHISEISIAILVLLTLYWLYFAITTLPKLPSTQWAKKIFGISLLVLGAYSILLIFEFLLQSIYT